MERINAGVVRAQQGVPCRFTAQLAQRPGPTDRNWREKRPVDAARQRAGKHCGQVSPACSSTSADELHTVADADAAEAQIESVTTEAAECAAAATARASRSEQARRQAEAERVEADAAATEASELAELKQATIVAAQQEVGDLAHALDQVTAELTAAPSVAEVQNTGTG
ncbi:hypothetical protein E3O06_11785 [Cryobacterium glaciale]|uniref:Uncharacterized protein n=1 Tax=Cryobacterium glaciale TaxID=1259145 RepID=A0A4R8UT87_9MICO|nr:hypothetical protein [Cryobacterium glaciale]TFB71520.1 hypothetical protein E3O06_11785 [Cryobacterium glaciale]